MDSITGIIERVTYYNPENGYSVIRLKPEQKRLQGAGRDGLLTAVGGMPELSPGEHVRLGGNWITHPRHGLQFQVETCEQILPATMDGIRRYLGSGLIKGIGPRLAEKIVVRFGIETLTVIEETPERLSEVEDIGPKRTRMIAKAWEEQKQVKEVMLFLHSHGVSTNLAVKIYKQYGDQSLQIVQSDPYRLAKDIFGIGFRTADRIAQSLGLPADHPGRIDTGVLYILNEMSGDGHVFAPWELLLDRAAELLEQPAEIIPSSIERLTEEGSVCVNLLSQPDLRHQDRVEMNSHTRRGEIVESEHYRAVYLTPFFNAETGVAGKLMDLNFCMLSNLSDLPSAFLPVDPQLSTEQQSAIRTALSNPVSVLTGGPGTGKTTAIKALIGALEMGHKRYALAAPTGRAAKRLSEATGRPASTIHRLLGYSPGEGFKFHASNPLPVDMLVVDEASMLDLLLTNTLIKALKPGTHLLLVGDVDQLPSVGAGDVLRDIIHSRTVPVTRLGVIFRQAADSHIITNAHRINHGEMPIFKSDSQDFFLFPAENPEEAAHWVQEVVSVRIPARFKLHAKNQIQVLSPMYRGPAGVDALNARLQSVLNPPAGHKPEKNLFGQLFRQGDKVMQTENNYDKEVFNGDIGILVMIDLLDHTMVVDFDGRRVTYDWMEADQLVLAYVVSVHKAQGSEFPVVVIPLVTAHYMMLQRNLLYTAVTRARQVCVLVGSRRAIGIAVRNDKVIHRFSALDDRLMRAR